MCRPMCSCTQILTSLLFLGMRCVLHERTRYQHTIKPKSFNGYPILRTIVHFFKYQEVQIKVVLYCRIKVSMNISLLTDNEPPVCPKWHAKARAYISVTHVAWLLFVWLSQKGTCSGLSSCTTHMTTSSVFTCGIGCVCELQQNLDKSFGSWQGYISEIQNNSTHNQPHMYTCVCIAHAHNHTPDMESACRGD